MTNVPLEPWMALQRAIHQKRLNYTEVAQLAGLSRQYVSHLANGRRRPTDEVITQLASVLEIPEQVLRLDVASPTSPDDILVEIDSLIAALGQRLDTATAEIKAKRDNLQQLAQESAA